MRPASRSWRPGDGISKPKSINFATSLDVPRGRSHYRIIVRKALAFHEFLLSRTIGGDRQSSYLNERVAEDLCCCRRGIRQLFCCAWLMATSQGMNLVEYAFSDLTESRYSE